MVLVCQSRLKQDHLTNLSFNQCLASALNRLENIKSKHKMTVKEEEQIRIRQVSSVRSNVSKKYHVNMNFLKSFFLSFYCTNVSSDLRSIQLSLNNGTLQFSFVTYYFPFALCKFRIFDFNFNSI